MIAGSVKAEDGMDLELYDSFEATTPEQLPTEEQVAKTIKDMIAQLEKLRTAPVVEPYTGPAIILNRAAAVFFEEFGIDAGAFQEADAARAWLTRDLSSV